MNKEKLKTLITDYKLSNKMLALAAGINPSSFYEKLTQPGQNFSPEQFKLLTQFLKRMGKELSKLE